MPELNHSWFPNLQPASPELVAEKTKAEWELLWGAGSSKTTEIPEASQEQTPFPGPELSLGSACRSEDAHPA